MYSFDPEITNQALAKTGSSYQMPAAPQTPAAPQESAVAAPVAAEAPAHMPQATDTEVPPDGAAPPVNAEKGPGWGEKSAAAMDMVPKSESGAKKLGALFGTVMSFYTGNYAGGAKGLSEMRGEGAK